ncbi:hypothetical protein AOQ84DRAFT_364154 [Glonium stellatum]|uniref:Uncharacterized protein n=1 Tax=Glonium stellatum TaxID=574774 RepID=A0A8E2F1V0_9PEZI|nr:hypothetical protein AOQ84DRAFT_364154 [Glonium stellatum]
MGIMMRALDYALLMAYQPTKSNPPLTNRVLAYSGRGPPSSAQSRVEAKESKFIQIVSEKSRKALLDKKILDCEDVPVRQRLQWQISLEGALSLLYADWSMQKTAFPSLCEKYAYEEVIAASPQWRWDWNDMHWHLLLCFEHKKFQWGGPFLVKVVPAHVFFGLGVSIKPMRGWEGCRELMRRTMPAPDIDREWEMVERFLARA